MARRRDMTRIPNLLAGAAPWTLAGFWGICGVAGSGCSSGVKPDLESPVASARIEAAGDAASRRDPKEIRELIALLDSDDPAVRVFTIASLEKITGQRLGYDPADPERLRREATDRWQAWYGQEYGVTPADDRWKDNGGGSAGVGNQVERRVGG